MEEFKGNSHKSREKKVDKVISGTAKTRKKTETKKFTESLFSEDIDNIKTYIAMDVLMPAVKKAVCDIVTNGVNMALYGEVKPQASKSTASKVSYRNYYGNTNEPTRRQTGNNRYDYDDIIVGTRGEAEEILHCMDEIMREYNVVSVADLHDLVGITCDFTANKYGWTDIRSARAIATSGGYLIKMPRPTPI